MRQSNISASRVADLCPKDAAKSKTAQSYILDLAMCAIGIEDDFDTAAMRHGRANQYSAFDMVVVHYFPEAVWHDEYIPIDDRCGASPDVLIKGAPLDVKCPYEIFQYFEQINSVPKKYAYQLQMQMIATGAEESFLCYYLTRPETFGQENWQEYPVDIEDRYRIFEFKKSEEIQEEIMNAVDKWHPKKLAAIKLLKDAEHLDLERYFFESKKGPVYRRLKDANDIFNVDRAYRLGDEFFYYKRP